MKKIFILTDADATVAEDEFSFDFVFINKFTTESSVLASFAFGKLSLFSFSFFKKILIY